MPLKTIAYSTKHRKPFEEDGAPSVNCPSSTAYCIINEGGKLIFQ
jgi:hypothetical protein